MTKHDAMMEYLRASPLFDQIACQFGTMQDGSVIFCTEISDSYISTDILGHKTKAYNFALVAYKSGNADAASGLNLEALNAVEKFMVWIDEQERARNYPEFENCKVTKIENLQNTPSVAGTDADGLIKYMCQARVTYKTVKE